MEGALHDIHGLLCLLWWCEIGMYREECVYRNVNKMIEMRSVTTETKRNCGNLYELVVRLCGGMIEVEEMMQNSILAILAC